MHHWRGTRRRERSYDRRQRLHRLAFFDYWSSHHRRWSHNRCEYACYLRRSRRRDCDRSARSNFAPNAAEIAGYDQRRDTFVYPVQPKGAKSAIVEEQMRTTITFGQDVAKSVFIVRMKGSVVLQR